MNLFSSWRISGDVRHFQSMLNAININANLTQYAGPGGWNDADMYKKKKSKCSIETHLSFVRLLGSDSSVSLYLTPYQSRAQFNMWAIMASPL